MPRVLSEAPNKLILHDNISDCEIELSYTTPTPKQVASYMNGMTKRVRNKIVNRVGENRQQSGLEVLAGIREGDFMVMKDDAEVPLSSTPGTPYYDPEWKKKVAKFAPDLIDALAIHVFEATSERTDPNDVLDDEEKSIDLGDDSDPN